MVNKILKRDGKSEAFDFDKIIISITKSAKDCNVKISNEDLDTIIKIIEDKLESQKEEINVEKLQDIIESGLYIAGLRTVKKSYSEYRKERTIIRERKSDMMKTVEKIGIETDRDNANVGNNFSSKLLRIASETNKWYNLANMPKHLAKLHENGDLYFHDLDSYNLTINCLNIETGKILRRGFNTGYGSIRPPKRIDSAAELSCILLQSTQNDMFGGQAHVNFDNDMAYFVNETRKEIQSEYNKELLTDSMLDATVNSKLRAKVKQAMQQIVYNLNTMHSRAGSQVPFSSINLGIPQGTEQEMADAALVCESFLEEYEKGLGKGEQPIFPNIVFRCKKGINKNPEDPYYYLYELACRVASKRMNPMFMNIDADFNLEKYNEGILAATMGCRTYVMSNINGEDGPGARGNIAPVTLNLPRIGILAEHSEEEFFKILNQRLEQARESLLHRYGVLKHLKVSDLPFVAGEGLIRGSEGLNKSDSIEPILKQGSWGIGYIGLAETLTALTGKHHGESDKSRQLGLKIIQFIRDFCDKYKQIDRLNYACYATPKFVWVAI